MQAKSRYLLLFACFLFFGVFIFWLGNDHDVKLVQHGFYPGRPYLEYGDLLERDVHVVAQGSLNIKELYPTQVPFEDRMNCRLDTCFDFTKCRKGFKVYVYPTKEELTGKFAKIISAVKESRYYTSNPNNACLFILSIDTLDRDPLSQGYVKSITSKIDSLTYWNQGKNHLIFNLYSGTWPDYDENDLGFNIGYAMLAKASMSEVNYRPGFDISFPLFHDEHTAKGNQPGKLVENNVPPVRKYMLAFKGKRYLFGIGSDTRNMLYHISNSEDIVLLTTCRHGRDWKRLMDGRCEEDNKEYDKYDYKALLHNSTFCLVPRGRRIGSYRLLEALQAGCVPVLLSNSYVLPFSEVIDWNKAAIWGDERLLLQIPSIVRSINHMDLLLLRQQTQFLWDSYFSSITNMVNTALEITKDRVTSHKAHNQFEWNTAPGAIQLLSDYTQNLQDYPFFLPQLGLEPPANFSALIYATSTTVMQTSPITHLIKNLAKSKFLKQILILWHNNDAPPRDFRWPLSRRVPISFKVIKSITERMYPHKELESSAVLSLDENAILIPDEIDFAFSVWSQFPTRIVGYISRSHYWDDSKSRWGYSSRRTNDYSMVLSKAAFVHKYYLHMFSFYLPSELRKIVSEFNNCEDILLNLLVTHITHLPPLKLAQRHQFREAWSSTTSVTPERELQHFLERHTCLNSFAAGFGYLPLIRSNLRFDPILYKDRVSIARKKFRQIESVS